MKIGSFCAAATIGVAVVLAQGIASRAAEVTVLGPLAMRSVMNELAPRFERESGHKLVMKFDVIGAVKRQIDAGEKFDVVILTPAMIEELAKNGKLAAGTQADIGRSGIGIVVRAGAPKPDISSADAFKRTLLRAKSITYAAEGATGMYLAGLFQRLGIAEEMKAKTKLTVGGRAPQDVAAGEAELALVVISAITPTEGAEILGPLPPELQNYVVYTGAVGAAAQQAEAGKALITFLKAPAAAPVLKAKGMEPAAP
jgi:molybdate transport system substrate-binding protein